MVKRLRKHNTRDSDFEKNVKLLFQRLHERKYSKKTLNVLFKIARSAIDVPSPTHRQPSADDGKTIFIHFPYDPRGFTTRELHDIFHTKLIEGLDYISRVVIGYRRPPNLMSKLSPRCLRSASESPSEIYQQMEFAKLHALMNLAISDHSSPGTRNPSLSSDAS